MHPGSERRFGSRRLRPLLNGLLGHFGIEAFSLTSIRHPVGRRSRLMRSLGVDLVIDVGASAGQFALQLRRSGYRGRILSFEPLAAPFADLLKASQDDPSWEARNAALGAAPGRSEMHVAANSVSSSLLPMLSFHEKQAPSSLYVGVESVVVETLDRAAGDPVAGAARPFLKIDAQGYEAEVLAGAAGVLPRMAAIQVELSLVPLYAHSPDWIEVVSALAAGGFRLVGIEPGFAASNGFLLQADGIFVREPLVLEATGSSAWWASG